MSQVQKNTIHFLIAYSLLEETATSLNFCRLLYLMKRNKHNPTIGLTKEEVAKHWIKESRIKFGDYFNYEKVKTLNTKKDKVIIKCCVHGEIETTFETHLQSSTGCYHCGQAQARDSHKIPFEDIVQRIYAIHPERDFRILSRKLDTRRMKTSKIFVQDSYGICKMNVGSLLRGSKPSLKSAICPEIYFKNKCNHIHKYNHLDFSIIKFPGSLDYVTLNCTRHGKFSSKPNWVLSGRGCNKCYEESESALRLTNKEFKSKAIKVHGAGTYDYSRVQYLTSHKEVLIGCKIPYHGFFPQRPNTHLNGSGCPVCGAKGGYGREDYVKAAKGRKGILYIIKCWDGEEEFYKIGITVLSVDERYRKGKGIPYQYESVYEYSDEAGRIWDLEKLYLKKHREVKHSPLIQFQGYTECFTMDLPVEEIISQLSLQNSC